MEIVCSIDGGDFGSGFASGAVSSLISSGVELISDASNSMSFYGKSGWSPDTYTAITIAAGGLSGGLSSTIAGGSFWRGARQGLITSGVNHVVHKIEKRNIVNERLKNIGLRGSDKPPVSTMEIDYLIDYDPTLNSMYENAGNPEIGIDQNLNVAGITRGDYERNKVVSTNLGLKAFRNYYSLYQTIAHELFHGIQFVSGTYGKAVKKYGLEYAKPLMEAQALHFNWLLDQGNISWFMKENIEMVKHFKYYNQ